MLDRRYIAPLLVIASVILFGSLGFLGAAMYSKYQWSLSSRRSAATREISRPSPGTYPSAPGPDASGYVASPEGATGSGDGSPSPSAGAIAAAEWVPLNEENMPPPHVSNDPEVMAVFQKMSLEEKVGQILMVGFQGTEAGVPIRGMITKRHIGGVILFSRNIVDVDQVASMNGELQSVSRIPLLIAIDQEGGPISRIGAAQGGVDLPSNHDIGNTRDPERTARAAGIVAEELKPLGFNMNMAPVLDVNTDPNNKVIGDRSYGDEPSLVAEFGTRYILSLLLSEMIPVAKHFPGHGDTVADSHQEMPVVAKDLGHLQATELPPFASAISIARVPAIMVNHVWYKTLDSKPTPAVLSRNVILGLLRRDMRFDGVVITDDMEMGGITQNNRVDDAALKALQAGADIILISRTREKQVEAYDLLVREARYNPVLMARVDEAVLRILDLKSRFGMLKGPVAPPDASVLHRNISVLRRDAADLTKPEKT